MQNAWLRDNLNGNKFITSVKNLLLISNQWKDKNIIYVTIMCDWLIDWFWRHVHPSKVISCPEVMESRSLYVHIYTFVKIFLKFFWGKGGREGFLHLVLSNMNVLNRSIWSINGTLTRTNKPGQSGSESNSNEGVPYTFQIFIRGVPGVLWLTCWTTKA